MKTSLMGMGFIGSRYAELYPDETHPEPRDQCRPAQRDVLFSRSTVSNYNVFTDPHLDIETNLAHLMDVLPRVEGTFSFLSSWFAFGRGAGYDRALPAREEDRCEPTGMYSITKRAAEQIIQSYCATVGINGLKGPSAYRIIRLCNVIGNDPRAGKQKNALEYLICRLARNEDVDLYTGDQYRNTLHVDDVCRAIHLILTKGDLNAVYNVGAPRSERIHDLIEYARTRLGSTSRVNLVTPPRFHTIVQTPDFWMDTTKVRALGFVPDMTAYQAVDRIIANL